MLLKFICCDVFARMAYKYALESAHTVDLELVPMLAHIEPEKLHKDLQTRIDRCATERNYDAILVGYGLCGNATVGLKAPGVPLILPRMHDCCTMFCGGKENFLKEFGAHPSMRWRSACYYERFDLLNMEGDEPFNYKTSQEYLEYVEQYGEEMAEDLWIMMHPDIETDEAAYIEIDGFEFRNCCELFTRDVALEDKTVKKVQGRPDLFKALVNGPWDAKDFLTVNPGEKIVGVYDQQYVMKAAPCEE